MPLLFKHSAFLPICLTLGALCALPTLADPPAAPTAGAAQTQSVPLQHTVPGDILKTLHWDQAANLPPGVTRVSAQPATNSLSVVATPAGLAGVREIVKLLDIEPRQVQIKFALAKTTTAALAEFGTNFDVVPVPGPATMPPKFMGHATGGIAAQLLQALKKQGTVLETPTVTTTNNVSASLSLTGGPILAALPEVESFTYAATPRVNSDGTVTLSLHPHMTMRVAGVTNPNGTPATTIQDLQTTRTIRSGDTLVLANLFPGAAGADDSQLLLFVTPTILPAGGGTAAVTVK